MLRNDKRFPCPDCHKTFATQVDLKAHLMRHITQHPYVCFACGKGFKYDHTLDFHIKSQHGAENGTGTGSSGKNESFNLKSLNRKSCKMKREMVDDKSGSSVISGVGLFGIGSGTGTVSGSGSGSGSGTGIGTGLDNQNNNRPLNNSSSIGERNKQQRRDQPLIGRLREMDDPIGLFGISSDIISQHQQHHNQHNQPQHVLTNNPLQIPGSLIEPNSILNGLKFPISLSSYPSCTTTASHTSTLNSIPFVPTTLLPSSGSTLTSSSLPSSVSSPSLIPSLASSLLTSSTNSTNSTSTATIAKTTTPITTSTANKDKISSIAANTSNLASNLPLIDFGLQGDLSPRNLQIKSEKVLISVLEGVHPVNEQTYSLYKCCLCGFAFPSLEPVSIHIQSLHSNNLNLTCDKCGATFKWKSELQLHEQLHKAMDQSVNNFILNNGEEIDSNNNNSNSDGNNNNMKNPNNNNIKSKSQLQNHHSLQNQLKQDHNHPHLQKQLQLQLQQLQQHQHQQQSQQSSRSLIMPSFLQPNLVFMNQYLNSDDHKIGNDNDDIRRRSNIGIKEEDEGNEGMNQEDADEESKCDQDENIDEDDGRGLNLSLKPQYKTKVEDVNPSYDKNNSMMMSMMMMRNKNNNMKLNNNINNENDENNNNGHDRMTSMDEPIDLKIESFSDSNNNNINNLGNNIISNSLNFLHSSLLPSSMGLSFPPMPSSSSTSISTSAAQASAAAAAAAVFAKNIAPKQSQLHQQNIGGLNSFQLQNIGPSNVSRSISSSSLSTGTISSVSSSGGATLNAGNVNVNVNVNGIGNIGMGKITEPIGDIEETAPGQFKCRFCDKTFDRIFSVHRHERVHTGYKPCICKECGRGFSEKRNLRHHTIRFHSDGSGRELLKRNRKEKSMASAASFLKKAAVRLLSNSSVEGSAMEEDDVMSNRLTSDNNNNNINININSNNNNNNGDDGKNDMKNCSSNYNYKNNDNTDGSKDDEFDQRSRISDDISGNTDNYNSTFNCNDKDDNNNNNNNNGDEDDDNNNVNYYNNYHHKQMNMKRMNRKNINNNNICDNKEMGSDANGDSNIEDNIGDKICLNSSSLSSSSSLSLSLSLSSSSRRRKSKPSKKISNNIESGDKSDEECEADENVGIKEEAKEGEEKEMEEDIEGDEDDEEDAEVDDEREEGYRHGHGYRQRRGHGHGQRDGNERERNEEDVNGNEDEDGDDDSMMITGDEEAVGLIDDDYNDDKNNNNNNNTNNDNNSMERRNGENGDEKVNDSIDNINNRKNIENDLNGSVNGNNNNHNLHEGKLRLHGAFFSNYSPRLALVDKVTKRGESSRPMIGPDGRYLYSYL